MTASGVECEGFDNCAAGGDGEKGSTYGIAGVSSIDGVDRRLLFLLGKDSVPEIGCCRRATMPTPRPTMTSARNRKL